MTEGSSGSEGAEKREATSSQHDDLEPISLEARVDEAAFFRALGERLGLSDEETFGLGNKLSYRRERFLADLYAEQRYLTDRLGTFMTSRQDLEQYQPEIEAWHADSERSPNRESRIHGPAHFMRVLINAQLLSSIVEPQLSVMLSRLSARPIPEDLDYMVEGIDREAVSAFAVGHDWARVDDELDDPAHGARAADSLNDPTIFPALQAESRSLASALMRRHSLEDDPSNMVFEDHLARDADLLDRHRDDQGPDTSYIRLHATTEIDAVAYALAVISDSLIDKGVDQVDAVLSTAQALGIIR